RRDIGHVGPRHLLAQRRLRGVAATRRRVARSGLTVAGWTCQRDAPDDRGHHEQGHPGDDGGPVVTPLERPSTVVMVRSFGDLCDHPCTVKAGAGNLDNAALSDVT